MEKSCTGHVFHSNSSTLRGRFSSGSLLVTAKSLSHSLLIFATDALYGARSCAWRLIRKQAMAYKEADPQMFVRIIVPPTARVMYTYNSRCYPWEDKKQ
ncbi:hypothetical protein L2106_05470 [Citrobacter portucalensis]|uniref:Phosphate starvation-inducible protein PhoH n=1 Tax=Citrobacter portucalensis TaxID=1639133 RepID=A0ABZ0GXU2_9ENTR|nr:hypothetical protein [Citrobacter portucalensis]MCE9896244.1 hypothetical protein [Citrobacter portucalensis]MDE9572879.1 hypothetical protein [Citrobacter portucalensis]MDE9648199.1 hypothetical protein [Citrobacter portucalensis]MDE9663000.1 hypothetical protein [Citrobacter portucalensis]MDE9672096.1 hypothetical protein [Citrobacter portucalensis]